MPLNWCVASLLQIKAYGFHPLRATDALWDEITGSTLDQNLIAGVTGHNGHKPKRPQPKRPQTETATNRNGHKPERPQTGTATNRNGHRPKRPQTETATNRNGHKPERPQTETATDRNGHKPKRPHQLSPITSVVTRINMM